MFADIDRSNTATIPLTDAFTPALFRNVYNDHFAQIDYQIADEGSEETQALLPPLVTTVEIVGDDTMNLSYDDYIYLVTGYYPKNNKSMGLRFTMQRMGPLLPTLITDAADVDAPMDIYHKFGATVSLGWNRNLICIEPSFVLFVAGIWEEPNNSDLYAPMNPSGTSLDQKRFQGNTASATTLDRGSLPEYEYFRNADTWLANPATEDAIGAIGSGTGERASINYWMNGGVSFDFDRDPEVIEVGGTGLRSVKEAGEGSESYMSHVYWSCGASTLQHFPDA